MSLVIRTPLGNIVHTGDWKIDHEPSLGPLTDEARFRALGDEGVLALMCDSTNAMRDGVSPSEEEVSESLAKIIEDAEGRVAITTFSSNVGRIRSIAKAADAAGREVLLLGSSMKRVCDVARDVGLMEGIKPVHRRRRIRLYPARQGRRHPDRQPGRAARRAGQDLA